MVLEKKGSARVEAGQRRVLDEATRQRRLTRQLEALEKDNFQDDPLSSLPPPGPTARLPAFSETEEPEKKKRKTRGDHFKQRFRKNFTTLLEEENLSEKPEPNYLSAAAPPSSLPPRHFCCVCGFPSHYTCTTCGGRYCSSRCLCTHRETRYGGRKLHHKIWFSPPAGSTKIKRSVQMIFSGQELKIQVLLKRNGVKVGNQSKVSLKPV
ncbi:zinc finger HIT domain-containing protein 1 [Stegastes partitus]|uniref:Zinc finger HIT domain-containing protein 1 n=1 Tax=Stegastes partitus TaxID=144197 RepID=A0A9Y4NVU6_9TELE|nr:PREDICTED: zinc finger HIT domain-containing protein 1 [Stegastes partitus]